MCIWIRVVCKGTCPTCKLLLPLFKSNLSVSINGLKMVFSDKWTFRRRMVFMATICLVSVKSSMAESVSIEVRSNCSFLKEHECKNGECIDKSKLCNGEIDCMDESDEENCYADTNCNPPMWLKCDDGECIVKLFWCDGHYHCADKSDEKNCSVTEPESLPTNCTGQFKCDDDDYCIPMEWVCDGENNCADFTDEKNCKDIGTFQCKGFKCKNGHCIPSDWRCDKSDDCMDNSDEEHCDLPVDDNCDLNDGLFPCKDNSSCIPAEFVCDGHPHCQDKSDEGGDCNKPDKNCLHAKCSHGCIMTPDGPFCTCSLGFGRINQTNCEDLDECHLLHGHCSQRCKNLPGSYECFCDKGYTLQKDGQTCKADEGDAILVFSTADEVRAFDIHSRKYFYVQNDTKQAVGVAYDGVYVYWSELDDGYEAIVRSFLNGSNREIIVKTGIGMPEDIAIDWYTGNLYFTDSDMKHIGVCSNDGLHCSVIISSAIEQPRAIVLNPENGEMYWTDWGSVPEIAKAKMDGSNDRSIVSTNITWPNGLALDYPNDRLYWVDGKRHIIESVRLDGSHRKQVLQNIHHPYWIAVFEDRLYWSDWGAESLQVCDKFTGKNKNTLAMVEKIYGIHIYHPVLAQKKMHACEYNPCTHLCLLKGNNSYTCACPEGKTLSADKRSCDTLVKETYLLAAAGNKLLIVHHQILGRHNIVTKTFPINFDLFIYDNVKDRVIVYDNSAHIIYSVEKFDSDHPRITALVTNGIGKIEGMDFDYITDTLYWSDTIRGTIEVFSMHTNQRAVLFKTIGGNVIIDIALVSEYGLMFLAVRTIDQKIGIIRMGMDGTGVPVHIIDHGLKGPVVRMRYDPEYYVIFIADSGGKKIEMVHIDGTERVGFRDLTSSPGSIAVLGQYVFWTSQFMKRFYWTNKNDMLNKSIKKSRFDLPFSVSQLHIAAVVPPPNKNGLNNQHDCSPPRSPCSHICVQGPTFDIHHLLRVNNSSRPHSCLCPEDMILSSDMKTCDKRVNCNSDQFTCRKSNICVDKSRVCDGKINCEHGEDEEGCAGHNIKCETGQFQCSNGHCIHHKNRCDKHFDCSDKSDEENCENFNHYKRCKKNQYQCHSGMCIENRLVCDGINDCIDNDDEEACDKITCNEEHFFQCRSGNCIPKEWKCDMQLDCPDASDELNNCSYNKPCEKGMFRCRMGLCIDMHLHCDRNDDCGDGSDETDCPTFAQKLENACPDTNFTCETDPKICLHLSARCNGKHDCPKGEDEMGCSAKNTACKENEWKCHIGDYCIKNSWRCDDAVDCPDGSDEDIEECEKMKKNPVTSWDPKHHSVQVIPCVGGYRCTSGQCIDFKLLCDGFQNCYDGSDEKGACDTACRGSICEDDCIKTPRGGICTCRKGKILAPDGHSCIVPPLPCLSNPSPCHHLCTDTQDSFVCSCFEGYSLRSDRWTCKALGERMNFLYLVGGEIRQMRLPDSTVKVIHKDSTPKLSGLDVYSKRNSVFFSIEDLGEIHRLNLKTKKETVVSKLGRPTLLAIDWITENMYFINNAGASSLVVCHLDNKKCATILDLGDEMATALVIDPINRVMFIALTSWWVFNHSKSRINKVHLDGTHITEILKTDLNHCTGLTVDYEKKILYFSDRKASKIESINYEGTNRKKIYHNNPHVNKPVGLAMFEDEIYFGAFGTTKVTKCKLVGEPKCYPINIHVYSIEHFKIQQSSTQKHVANVCSKANCTHICIQAPNGAKCICPNGDPINEHDTCKSNKDVNSMPVFAENNKRLLENNAGNKAISATIIIFTVVFLITSAVLMYRCQRKRFAKTWNPDYSIHFQNPTFQRERPNFSMSLGGITSKFPNLIRPNQSEYVNPLTSKLVPNDWPPNTTVPKMDKRGSMCKLEVPNLLADSDSDVESDRDLHDGEHREKTRLIL